MITSNDKSYIETKQILLEDRKPSGIFGELSEWISNEFDIKVLNICFDYITPAGEIRPRLEVVLENIEDETKFRLNDAYNYDSDKQQQIVNKFIELNSNCRRGLFRKKDCKIENLERLFVIFSSFVPIAKADANSKISREEIVNLMNKYKNQNIWEISKFFGSVTLFFLTNDQVELNKNSNLVAEIEKEYLSLLYKYDQFGYFLKSGLKMNLDSKENFDKNYDSNWYYYYK